MIKSKVFNAQTHVVDFISINLHLRNEYLIPTSPSIKLKPTHQPRTHSHPICRRRSQCGGAWGWNPCKSRPALSAAWLAKTLPARSPRALSSCWCWLLTANLFTWTGIGTTSLLFCWAPLMLWCGPVPNL